MVTIYCKFVCIRMDSFHVFSSVQNCLWDNCSYAVLQENEKSRDILIEQRFHKSLIGAAGGNIKEIRDRFNQVQITFPDPGRKSEVVQLRGPKTDVDKCYKYLQKIVADMVRL